MLLKFVKGGVRNPQVNLALAAPAAIKVAKITHAHVVPATAHHTFLCYSQAFVMRILLLFINKFAISKERCLNSHIRPHKIHRIFGAWYSIQCRLRAAPLCKSDTSALSILSHCDICLLPASTCELLGAQTIGQADEWVTARKGMPHQSSMASLGCEANLLMSMLQRPMNSPGLKVSAIPCTGLTFRSPCSPSVHKSMSVIHAS